MIDDAPDPALGESAPVILPPPAHARRSMARRRLGWHPVAGAAIIVLLVVGVWAVTRAHTAYNAYEESRDSIAALQALSVRDPAALTPDDLQQAELELTDFHLAMMRLDSATSLPPGMASAVAAIPWLGERYTAARSVVQIGELLGGAGATLADVGREALGAYNTSGTTARAGTTAPTWLDVIARRDNEIGQAAAMMGQAKQLRAGLNPALLPAQVTRQLPELDRALQRVSPALLSSDNRHALLAALGANQQARYLVMFQNPEELRPSGGFPGTVALVTIARGQLVDVQFYDVHQLTEDYIAHRTEALPQPWPIQQYFPQNGFLLQDATWYPDFPRSAEQVMAMYAETTWPSIDGIIAVDPAVIQDLLRVTGPVTVDVDGEQQTITADNLTPEIERQRLLEYHDQSDTTHKELVALVGQQMLDRIKSSDRSTLKSVAERLSAAADRRDIQIYSGDAHIESLLDARRWSGRLEPDPQTPTLAVDLANVALGKSSELMVPSYDLTLGAPVNGRRQVSLHLHLVHTGNSSEDPFYAGFQRWWIELALPPGSSVVSSDRAPLPDPDSPNGGSYTVDLFPGQSGDLTVTFSMPDSSRLLLRREPGLTNPTVTVGAPGCESPPTLTLSQDLTYKLDQTCPAP